MLLALQRLMVRALLAEELEGTLLGLVTSLHQILERLLS